MIFNPVYGGASAPNLGSKTITANGTYLASADNLDGYDEVTANVPNTYSASDEGKVVSNGALTAQTSATYTSNNTYDTTLINSVTVNVSGGGGATLITKTITANGTYDATDDNADGYSSVIVNVSGSGVIKIGYSDVTFTNTTTDDNIGDSTTGHITTSIASSSQGGMASSGTDQIIYTAIDVTDLDLAIARVYSAQKNTNSTYGGMIVGISSSLPTTYNEAKAATNKQTINQSASKQFYTLNTSSLTGTCYLFYAARLYYSSYGYCRADFDFICF